MISPNTKTPGQNISNFDDQFLSIDILSNDKKNKLIDDIFSNEMPLTNFLENNNDNKNNNF